MRIRSLIAMSVCAVALAGVPVQSLASPGGDHSHDHEPAVQKLGTVNVEGYRFEVVQEGAVTAGKEATFSMKLTKDDGLADPTAVRVWVGVESAKGSVKSKTHTHGTKMEAHADVPDPLPEGSKLWIEVELKGKKVAGSIAFK